jgi:superoxide dismutase, Cu-Zn family
MRSFQIAALSAALFFGCGDDDGGENPPSDASTDASKGRVDAAVDSSIDSSIDAAKPDAASSDASAPVSGATATLASKNSSNVTGTATFTKVNGVVTLTLSISGAAPGKHGTHIHAKGNCDPADASGAGGHWDPTMHNHGSGAPDASASSHLGDLGNITIAGDGKGTLTISKPEWTLGGGATTDVVGHAVVFHANQDDLITNMGDAGPGNSGGRLACGVITAN